MKNKFPAGWNKDKVKRVIDHYESQSEDDAVAEDQAPLLVEETLIQVPIGLLGMFAL